MIRRDGRVLFGAEGETAKLVTLVSVDDGSRVLFIKDNKITDQEFVLQFIIFENSDGDVLACLPVGDRSGVVVDSCSILVGGIDACDPLEHPAVREQLDERGQS
jgi:hypothetical protein